MDDIPRLATETSRAALARAGRWTAADYEDAAQEAALHIWQAAVRTPSAGRGYYARAGYTAAQGWIAAQSRHYDSMRVLAGYASAGLDAERRGWHDGKPWQEPLSDAQRDLLAARLAQLRGRADTAERDAGIVQALSRGLTQREIGEPLGISRWHVGVLRQRIRKTLEAYMENDHE